MAEELKKLKIKRSKIKAAVTRFSTYLKSSSTTNKLDTNEISARKTKFEETWNQFDYIQSECELLDEDELTSNAREEFESNYFSILALADKHLADNKLNTAPILNPNSDIAQFNIENCHQKIRLPKIDLPTFSGSYDEWYDFHDTFNSLIHSNSSILPIEKFHYLKAALKFDAADILQSLEISADNYNSAWEMLRDRYDNKRIIVQKHIKAMHDLPVLHKENLLGLRQILDGIIKHVRALKSIKRPADQWDDMLIYLITTKLDPITNKAWETDLPRNSIPTFKNMTDFLSQRCQILDAISRTDKLNITTHNNKHQIKRFTSANVSTYNTECPLCAESHTIYHCGKFINLSVDQRFNEAKSKKLCINCLRSNHNTNLCKSRGCKRCGKRHNTLLHKENANSDASIPHSSPSTSATTASQSYQAQALMQHTLLSTAVINVFDNKGNLFECRVLLDSGSQSCFMTEELVTKLGLKKRIVQIPVAGINQTVSSVNSTVQAIIKSRLNAFSASIQCLVLHRITENLPANSIAITHISVPKNIKLADPKFNETNKIDMLIGSELFWSLLCVGQIKTGKNQPYFQKTHFGWIVSGPIICNNSISNINSCNLSLNDHALDSKLTRFWQIEEYAPTKINYTPEELECEKHFLSTYKRNEQGRFVVQLPLKPLMIERLGDSKTQALKRFYALERKLDKNSELKTQYSSFINEYRALGHLKVASDNIILPSFYLPHHAVLKQTSLTTKLRVVFDGSAKSTTGLSLNDALMVGPVIQQDLLSIILRFRTHQFVLTADIAKMYRQVILDESQTSLQRILWRNHKNEQIKEYDLQTVTYGTASASFLAIRSLHKLAQEEESNYPVGSAITIRDFYVDDLLTGASTIHEAEIIRDEINAMLGKGGFELRKWVSNCPQLIQTLTTDATEYSVINLDKNESVKTLGLQWHSFKDVFSFFIPEVIETQRITKRTILSNIAQIFDPLGLIGPIIVVAKIIMQEIWQLKLNWDESVPLKIQSVWCHYKNKLSLLNKLTIPRWVCSTNQSCLIDIHGFCDASEVAYGACIYIRTTHKTIHTSQLMCSKSRVAPLKSISMPKLELCGALLLCRLMKKVLDSLGFMPNEVFYWTDSTIVLSWIKVTSRTLKTFVANRVSEIQEHTDTNRWFHVNTSDNPADIISRGESPEELINNNLWWQGPEWLQTSDILATITPKYIQQEDLPEQRAIVATSIITKNDIDLSKYSDLNKLIRIIAYCFRFASNLRVRRNKSGDLIKIGPLSTAEMRNSTTYIIKRCQAECFSREIQQLTTTQRVHEKSVLLSLHPFIDDQGVIRVGGRLRNSSLTYTHKHPIVLPKSHSITRQIIRHEHIRQLHSGCQATLAAIRSKYWPIGARNTIKQIIRQCVTCFRVSPKATEHLMGDLPSARLTPVRPFTNCGVDYFGPIYVRESRRRNSKTIKTYGAIFVCFAIKAVHIELVSDLTTETFLNALKRFISRRGKPMNIYSDNGTNFVGANRELQKLRELFLTDYAKNQIITAMANDGINWHFIPPRSPHFGGIWEAAVKSCKHHMKRVIGNASLSFEEMYTILVQIEGILNSRPLTPLSTDPNDFSYLTPAHFLIGDLLDDNSNPDLSPVVVNRLSHWQHVEQLRQHFWKRWSKEYLHHLQERTKWKLSNSTPLQLDQLVIVRDNNLPPLRWLLGRIESVHPGKDGIVRAATVRTANGTIKRATTKLCPFPTFK